jgi:NTP pyrophosphatase (non-canonical NTP hydrolase)
MNIEIRNKLRQFATDRDWDQFHNPKNLVMALSGEIGELNEIFQWLSTESSTKDKLSSKQLSSIEEEIADIYLYLIRLADKLDIDIDNVAIQKIVSNAKKYPIELSKGNATKYNKR